MSEALVEPSWVTGEGVYDAFALALDTRNNFETAPYRACVLRFHNNYMRMQGQRQDCFYSSSLLQVETISKTCTKRLVDKTTTAVEVVSGKPMDVAIDREMSRIQWQRLCVRYSEKYHDALSAMQEDLHRGIQTAVSRDNAPSDPENNKFDTQSNDPRMALIQCKQMQMVWHMFHNLYVVAPVGRSAQFYFWRWAQANMRTASANVSKEDIWSIVARQLVVGDVESSIRLLETSNLRMDKETKQAVDALLPHLKALPVMDDLVYADRLREWKEWSRSIHDARNDLIAISDRIKIVVAILCGDNWAISQTSESWMEYAISRLMYSTPEITLDRISEHTEQWFKAKPRRTNTDGILTVAVDDILKAVLTKDTINVLEKCASLFESSSLLTAHLADVLFCIGGCRMEDTLRSGLTLRQWFLLQYADQLMSNTTMDDGECRLLEMAGNYYAQCGVYGARRFATSLRQIPIANEQTGYRIIELAQENGLEGTVKYVCSVLGAQCVQRNDYISAVRWYTRGDHIRLAQRAAKELLEVLLERSCSIQVPRRKVSAANEHLVKQLRACPKLNLCDTQCDLLLRILDSPEDTSRPPLSRHIAQTLAILTEEGCHTIEIK